MGMTHESPAMTSHEQRIVRFLSRPTTYPHPVGTIERRETHVSHVFLAGAFAYKLKKPVKFPFLDASTLALRIAPRNRQLADIRFWHENRLVDVQTVKIQDLNSVHF